MANLLKPTGVNNVWATTGVKTDPGAIKASTGWVVELPPYQTANWIEWRQDAFIAHSNQHGIPEWDAVTEYQGNVSYTKGSNGFVYKCILTNINTDPANPLNSTYWTQAFETFGSVQVVADNLSAHLVDYSNLAGIGNTAAARTNLAVYSKTEGDARYAALAGLSTQAFNVNTATLSTHAVPLGQFTSLLTQATESTAGIAQIATSSEVSTGTNNTDMVTPLKLATLYLSKAGNLAGLANTATARTNLGLGAISTMSDTLFLKVANNLSDLNNASVARANLGLTSTATTAASVFAQVANNLSDLPNKATARANLQLADMATTPSTNVMFKYDNLAGITNAAVARSNLGLSDSGLYPSNTWLNRGNNLADLTNVQAARNALGLGSLSTRNVYAVSGDLDFSNIPGFNGGWAKIPGGITLQWGLGAFLRFDQSTYQGLHIPGTILNVQLTAYGTWQNDQGPSFLADSFTTNSFRVSENGSQNGRQFMWLAVTYTG